MKLIALKYTRKITIEQLSTVGKISEKWNLIGVSDINKIRINCPRPLNQLQVNRVRFL